MRLDQITISNVLGIARADVTLSPVTVFSGANAVGKSSISDAISMAFLGTPARVKLKKELGQLLHDGAEKGRVSIDYASEDGGANAEFRLPKGEQSADDFEGSQFLPYVLRPSLFASLPDDEKRTMLFELTGCKATGKVIRQKLIARGVSEELIDDFMPMLKGGFPSASKEAYARATAAKAVWRSITKATWGSVVAESWQAPAPEGTKPTDAQLQELLKQASKRQQDLEDGIGYIGQQEALVNANEGRNEKLEALEETAGLLKRRQAKLANTEKDLNEWEVKFPALLERLAELKAGSTPLICPCCDKELSMVNGKLEKFAGLKADTKALSDAALDVTKARFAVDTLKKVHANDLRDIADSESATKQLAKLMKEAVETADIDKLERARESVAKLRQLAAEERSAFNSMQQRKIDFDSVDEITKKAAAAHADVKIWNEVGDALAPDGIPNELLADALAPVNQSVGVLAGMCGWFKAEIGDDMQVRYGDRLYGLCSASEQWRADALLALAIAQISRCRIVVLDGFDIMIPKDRLALVQMSMKLTELESMDSILLLGTLKEMPKFNPTVGRVWIDGAIAENV